MTRSWKFWTKGKLDMLRDYAPAFNTASNSVEERIYLDLLAGERENVSRETGELFDGSPVIALSADPGFTRHRFIERDRQKAAQLDAYLRPRFPQKDFEVVPGDCNLVLRDALTSLLPYRWAPTFAFLDQQAADIHWATLQLAAGVMSLFGPDDFPPEVKPKVKLVYDPPTRPLGLPEDEDC
jgi:three-Cys-motif partner protein